MQTEVLSKGLAAFVAQLARRQPVADVAILEVLDWACDGTEPVDSECQQQLGSDAMVREDWPSAFDHFARACDDRTVGLPLLRTFVDASIAADRADMLLEAEQYAGFALAEDPSFVFARMQLYALYREYRDDPRIDPLLHDGLAIAPDDPDLLFALAETMLRRGDPNAWTYYENRPTRRMLAAHMDEYPEWQGESLEGKTILVMREQGLGDEIMFSRYLPVLSQTCGRMAIFTYPELARLMHHSVRGLRSDTQIVTREVDIPDFDYWVSSGSLPLRMARGDGPCYKLRPDHKDIERLSGRIVGHGGRLKVGLNWDANRKHPSRRFRAAGFDAMRQLLDLPNCAFYSLQHGESSKENDCLTNLCDYTHDLADVAAAISLLDVVVTTDSMIAHLAASMGKPTLVLLARWYDWRWTKAQKHWYPTAVRCRSDGMNAAAAVPAARAWLQNCAIQPMPVSKVYHCSLLHTATTRYGRMSWPVNDKYIGRTLELYGEYSADEARILERVLMQGDVVIEAGANIGALTAPMCEAVGPAGKVYAFEPQFEYYDLLTVNAPWAKCFNAAMSDVCGSIELPTIDKEKVYAPGWDTDRPKHTVQAVTIDSVVETEQLDRLHLIKVDVDGPEHRILKGGEKAIDRFRPILYVEYDKPDQYPEMLSWIVAKGYRVYQTTPGLYSPKNWNGNQVNVFGNIVSLMLLCIPAERFDLRADTLNIAPLQRVRLKAA